MTLTFLSYLKVPTALALMVGGLVQIRKKPSKLPSLPELRVLVGEGARSGACAGGRALELRWELAARGGDGEGTRGERLF